MASNEETVAAMLDNYAEAKSGGDPRSPVEPAVPESIDSVDIDWDIEFIPRWKLNQQTGSKQRTRDDIDQLFVDLVNECKPDNPCTMMEVPYPLDVSNLKLSYCTNSSVYTAKCGPRNGVDGTYIYFAVDRKQCESMTREYLVKLLVHELTHVTEGSHTQGSAHNPEFWKEFARNCAKVITSDTDWGIDIQEFVEMAVNDPNRAMTDRRMRTVEEQSQEILDTMRRELSR